MKLLLGRAGIDTHHESIAFLSKEALLCGCVGFHAMDRLLLRHGESEAHAILNTTDDGDPAILRLSDGAFRRLGLPEGTEVDVSPAGPLASARDLSAKIGGHHLAPDAIERIVDDIAKLRYSRVELTAFVVASTIHGLDDDEVHALIEANVRQGDRLTFSGIVADKHSIGGVPGNRTTPIVTAICAAAGLTVPKTSSRAITSPAGTADTMETLMDVELTPERIREVVAKTGACLAWGGAVNFAPADDIMIRVENPLGLDAEGLMIASILAKKKAAGSTHVLLDIPTGPGTKAPTRQKAEGLRARFERQAERLAMRARVIITDGSQPIGRGVGPALEARDVLAVLRGAPLAPADLREKSLRLAGELLALAGTTSPTEGKALAVRMLDSGAALAKFEAIRDAQGRRELAPPATQTHEIRATHAGRIVALHNAIIARAARLAGAPREAGSGLDVLHHVGELVEENEPILRVHAASEEALGFAREHLAANRSFLIEPGP